MRFKDGSQTSRVYQVLKDGNPHTIGEIHERVGPMRLNSRVAELRNRIRHEGKTVVCWCAKVDGKTTWVYQVVTLPEPTELHSYPREGEADGVMSHAAVGSGNVGTTERHVPTAYDQAVPSAGPVERPAAVDSGPELPTVVPGQLTFGEAA